jgi:hypothetical protein
MAPTELEPQLASRRQVALRAPPGTCHIQVTFVPVGLTVLSVCGARPEAEATS